MPVRSPDPQEDRISEAEWLRPGRGGLPLSSGPRASSPAPAGRGAAAGVYHTPEGSPPGGLPGPGAWVLHTDREAAAPAADCRWTALGPPELGRNRGEDYEPTAGPEPAIFWLGVPKFGIQTTRTLQKKSSISAESSRRDTSKSEVFSVLGALACTHDLLKVRPKCHYGVFFAQNFSLAKAITLANLTMHIYEVWTAGAPK